MKPRSTSIYFLSRAGLKADKPRKIYKGDKGGVSLGIVNFHIDTPVQTNNNGDVMPPSLLIPVQVPINFIK